MVFPGDCWPLAGDAVPDSPFVFLDTLFGSFLDPNWSCDDGQMGGCCRRGLWDTLRDGSAGRDRGQTMGWKERTTLCLKPFMVMDCGREA